jgi:DNA polymerase-4
MPRRIAHLDADAFYVSVELLRRPELRGLPVVVAGTGPRAVVTTASYEARRFGVGSAIPASRARRLCPQAVFLPPDFTWYREMSGRVFAIVREEIATIEQLGLDEAYLDLSDLISPRAAMRALVARIERETGLTCSVGIGPNKLVAKVASDAEKPRGMVCLTREEACARFAQAPPRLLPGIGPRTAERLDELGLRTLAQLREAPGDLLRERFGPRLGDHLLARAHFEDEAPLSTAREVISRSKEVTFDRDVADLAELRATLARLCERLCRELEAHGAQGRTIGIKVRLDDFTTVTRAHTLPHATSDRGLVEQVAADLLAAYAPPRPVRLLGVRVAGLGEEVTAAPQLELFS